MSRAAESPGAGVAGSSTALLPVGRDRLNVAIQPGAPGQPPLVFINGLGANLEMLDPFVEALAASSAGRIGTIRFDLPGVGGSPARFRPIRARGLTRLVDRLLGLLGHDEADVLGISWGGSLAQQLVHDYPERFRRLILVSTSTGSLSFPARLPVLLRLASPVRYLRASRTRQLDPHLYGSEVRDPEVSGAIARLMRPPSLAGYYTQLYALMGWSSLFWLGSIVQPTLILTGDDDPIVPRRNAELLKRRIPDARLHVVPDGGHLCLITRARALAPVVYDFLTELPVAHYPRV